jgi:hypothetical protein
MKGKAKAKLIAELIPRGCHPCRCFLASLKMQSRQQSLIPSLPNYFNMKLLHLSRRCLQAAKTAGGPTRVEKAKIGLIQFHLSPPKADIENTVVISDYAQVGLELWYLLYE